MWMSEDQIKSSYKQAKDQKKQRIILAQLNCVPVIVVDKIIGITDRNVDIRENSRWTKEEKEMLCGLYAENNTYEDISLILGRSLSAIKNKINYLRKKGELMAR